ncbi:hypothetical protein ASE13_05495 [Sphingomonas sp. Root241]|nr:hypothetical protein ASE13_05495 [Sphingomonas sp. Root241]
MHQVEAYGLPERRDTYFAYDKAGRLTSKTGSTINYVDQTNHIGLISATPVESYKYDKRGNLVEATDANGARTLFWYDELDRKVAELGALGTFSTYGYDGVGNLISSRTYATPIALPVTPGGTPPAAPGGAYRETSYAYDAINRLTSTSIAGVRTGAWNGSSFVLSTAAITTSYVYDAAGNVVSTTDANGVTSYAYYDKLGRKTLAVDALGYVTRWDLDAEGNVGVERRYAIQFSGASVAAPPALAESTSDRVTGFTYDKMGRRIAEHRYGVEAYVVNASTGVLSGNGGTASIYYSYNGLGQVTRKTEATGEYSDYEYDLAGRLVREQRATIIDYSGTAIRPVVSYYYDALGNLVRSVQAGGTAADRVTRYVYGAGGRLFSKVDPSGSVTEYYYDAAGNVLRENYVRTTSDGAAVYEGILYTRDILGRVITQTVGAWTGSSWNKGDAQQIQYNAYGEVAQKGINGGWQEQFAYDGAGRLYRSNSGDGVWRYYVHDANGNQSAVIESEGNSIAGLSLDQMLSSATGGFAYGLGQLHVDGLNVTINAYDKRGQAISTRLAQRQLSNAGGTTDIVTGRSYNAFGEVATETDARGYQTVYGYNAMGRTTYALRASVLVTYENGSQAWVNPSSHNYYDIAGRLIGQDDANGNRTTRTLLAGTGYGGSEAQVVWEWHADGGIVKNGYDRFGDLRRVTDEINRTTAMDYDAMGRLIQVTRPSGLTEYFAYDVLGQRIKHWNSFYGTANVETTDYDVQGRIVRTVAFGGDTTTTSYVWEGGAGANGLGAAPGAWTTLTTYANGRQSGDQSDLFGHLIASTDMGGHQTLYVYDLAGRMIQRSGGETINYDYLNTGLVGRVTIGIDTSASQGNFTQDRTSYAYDAAGNRLTEEFTRLTGAMVDHGYWEYDYSYGYPDQYWVSDWQYETSLVTISSQSANYDALGRLTYWSAAATGTTPAASTNYYYDANSNIRRSVASFSLLDQNGAAYSAGTQDYWYRYDSMNRVVTAKGIQTGSGIVRGGQGVDLLYDAAGQRTQALSTTTAWGQVYVEVYDPNMYGGWGGYTWQYQDVSYEADNREDYTYWGDGQLKDVRVAQSGYSDNGDGTITVTAPAATGLRKANYWYDGLGRLERQIDWGDADPDVYGNGALNSAIYDKRLEYNAKGQVTFEQLFQRQGGITQVNETTSDYGTGTGYALGALVSSTTNAWRTGVPYSTSTTSNSYAWYDGAALASTTVTGTTSGTTTYNYNGLGQLVSAWISDGRSRNVSFLNDANGLAIRRDEQDYVGQGDPHEIWYRFAGREMGYTGNNGTLETDYLSSVASRPLTPGSGAFRGGASYGQAHADFDQFYNPVTSHEQGGAGGSYTVRGGETLSTIAAQLWGDSNLWYRLAEVNGLSAGSALAEGQRLTIPAGVMRSSYNASTFAPYDPAAALGDTSPTTPTPQAPRKSKSNNCGVFGQLLLVVVAVAVTVASQGTLAGLLGSPVLGGAAAGVAGSVVSQTVGLATGIQNKFNFGAVAMAGIAGGIGGGLSSVKGLESIAGSKFLGDVARGAIGSTLTQGIGVATGLQSKFDFAGVAVAGLGAGVGGAVARGIDGKRLFGMTIGGTSSAGNAFLSGTASGVASAAARSLVTGTDFGDNLLAALPDVIGSTIGRMAADRLEALFEPRQKQVAVGQDDIAEQTSKESGGPIGSRTQAGAGSVEDMEGGGSSPVTRANAAGRAATDAAGDPSSLDLTTYGIRDVEPKTREENRRNVEAGIEHARKRTDLTQTEKTAVIDELERRGSYWDSILPSASALAVAGLAAIGISFSNGALSVGGYEIFSSGDSHFRVFGQNGLSIDHDGFSLGGDNGLVISNGVRLGGTNGLDITSNYFRLGGTNGIDITSDGLRLGGGNGLVASNDGLSIGGTYGLNISSDRLSIGGYTLVGDAAESIAVSLTKSDFPEIASQVSQKQFRHIGGRTEYRGGGYLDSVNDAQAVLQAYHSETATILGKTSNGGFPVVRVKGITGTNVNLGAGFVKQPTNVFIIKGTASPSIVPTNPNWRP